MSRQPLARLRRLPLLFLALPLALAPAATARAQEPKPGVSPVSLVAVEFPERKGVDVPFAATPAAPEKALLEATVKVKEGQASIDLGFKRMAPALLFGGDVTSYVVWAVTRDGLAENLGELWVRDESGSVSVRTGQKNFAMMVTAEAHPFVTRPSALLVFASQAAKSDYARNSPVVFGAFAPAPKSDVASVAGQTLREKTPVDLLQAAKVLALAEAMNPGGENAGTLREAKTNLAQATNSNAGGSSRAMFDYARRSLAKSGEAIRDAEKRASEKAAAEAAAKRKAELDALAAKAREAEEEARAAAEATRQTAKALTESEKVKAAFAEEALRLAGEKARLEAEQTRLKAERDALAARLSGALAKVSEVRTSGRGLILSLSSGILFDVNKAALKPAAQVTLAKLAGILLMLPDVNLRVEGYTDATGKAETNQKLSKARAESVTAFLQSQGIAEGRMKADGYGPANPVAPNDTAANKAKNRRVEVVLAEGEVKPADAK